MDKVHSPQADRQSPLTDFTRYVRVRDVRDGQFVEFDFAIGDPCCYVELVLPKPAFDEFCRLNEVVQMSEEQARLVDRDLRKWRYGDECSRR